MDVYLILLLFVFLYISYLYISKEKEKEIDEFKITGDIPLIIHQTWKNKDIIKEKMFVEGIQSWKQLNPDFEHRLYDDLDCLNFIKTEYPKYLSFYESLELPVQKADIFRYLVIHKYGGIYTDIDTICLKGIKEILDAPMIVGIEYLPEFNKGKTQYNQWFFGSVPNNPIFIKTVDEIVNRKKKLDFWGPVIMLTLDFRPVNKSEETYWLTGPYVFSDLVSKNKESIHIYNRCAFGSYDSRPECRKQGYLIHGFQGTWKNKWDESRMKW